MPDIVFIGAGLSGTLMAYEVLPKLRSGDRLTVISQGPVYHFVPPNPWVAIGWRKRSDIEIDLVDIMQRKGIRLLTQGAQRVHPTDNRIELADGTSHSWRSRKFHRATSTGLPKANGSILPRLRSRNTSSAKFAAAKANRSMNVFLLDRLNIAKIKEVKTGT